MLQLDEWMDRRTDGQTDGQTHPHMTSLVATNNGGKTYCGNNLK